MDDGVFLKSFRSLCDTWLDLKKKAKVSGDWKVYECFLRECKVQFSQLYLESKDPAILSLLEAMIKTATCELQEIIIKSKQEKVPF
jgi:hypothetical protein